MKFRVYLSVASFVLGFLLSNSHAIAAVEITNRAELQRAQGISQFGKPKSLSELKIAVLDNGFMGYQAKSGMLPDSAELIEGSVNGQLPTSHGLNMAQIVWAMTGQNPEGPKFYLINANGFSNFKAAVTFIADNKIDLVLYSQVWSFGSNFDGKGFINAEVSRAIASGALWINATGNHGGLVYNQSVRKYLKQKPTVEFENKFDENPVTIVLNWNDFADSETVATNKDLNLYLYDSNDKLIASSELIQAGTEPSVTDDSSGGAVDSKDGDSKATPTATDADKKSRYPRETLTVRQLARGTYRIVVQDVSRNFTASDKLRIHLINEKPGSLVFKDHTVGEEIFPPADHPDVLTVGESGPVSATGPTADGRAKPDLLIGNAIVNFSNGAQTRGSSNAAAIFCGITALMKSAAWDRNHDWGMNEIRQTIKNLSAPTTAEGLRTVLPQMIPYAVAPYIPTGARVMINLANQRLVVFSDQSPREMPVFRSIVAYSQKADDLFLLNPFTRQTWVAPRANSGQFGTPWVEFRTLEASSLIWQTPNRF